MLLKTSVCGRPGRCAFEGSMDVDTRTNLIYPHTHDNKTNAGRRPDWFHVPAPGGSHTRFQELQVGRSVSFCVCGWWGGMRVCSVGPDGPIAVVDRTPP